MDPGFRREDDDVGFAPRLAEQATMKSRFSPDGRNHRAMARGSSQPRRRRRSFDGSLQLFAATRP
jgi:hypothetical protein